MTPAPCHPHRPHVARGLCRTCYNREWARQKRRKLMAASARNCDLCGDEFFDANPRRLYCSPLCARVASDTTVSLGEERHATRDRLLAERLVSGYLARGCERVSRRVNRRTGYPYVAAWHRGGGLYLIRARLPAWCGEAAA